ncbi:hypothetical protein P692DRAFT_20877979 [Suillus brevipes Sb2]|nr:hypothetical protein P692DRAFT_20877979 [Suillus brevipes Sb2]
MYIEEKCVTHRRLGSSFPTIFRCISFDRVEKIHYFLQRDAASGAPKDVDHRELILDEEYHGPPSLDPNMQQKHQVVAVQVDPGEHGGGWPCCC